MRTLSGQARPSDSGAAVRRWKAVLSAILCSDVGRNRWGTILYCLRSTSEIMALMKLAVTSMNCGVAKSNSAGKRSMIPATRVRLCMGRSLSHQLFTNDMFNPGQNACSTTLSTTLISLPRLRRTGLIMLFFQPSNDISWPLIVASRLSFLRDQQFISSCRAKTSSKNCKYHFICLRIPVLCSSTSRDLHLIFDPTCLPVP